MISKGDSSLEALGSAYPSKIDQQSRTKKVKRFLQSQYSDCELLYFPFISQLLAGLCHKSQELVLIIDGTDLGKSCGALMLSVAWGKRSIPLVWLVKAGNKGHFSVAEHLSLVKQVSTLLPPCERIVLLGDGEFSSADLEDYAQNQGWEYVLRIAKNTVLEDKRGDSYTIAEVEIPKNSGYLWLEEVSIGKAQKYGLLSVLAWHQKGQKEPIYVCSNMEWAKDMMDYYKKRWTIESLFSDLKSRGFNIHKTRIKKPEMLHNLLIIVAMAFCFCLIIGQAKELFKNILPKIIRKDRTKSYSHFKIGKKIVEYCKNTRTSIVAKFRKGLEKYFCVRF